MTEGMIPVPDPTKLTTDAVEKMRSEIMTLVDEKFKSVDRRFGEIDRHRVEQKQDNQREIGSALTSANKTTEVMGVRVDDLNNRLTRVESEKSGGTDVKTGVIAAVGLAAVLFTLWNSRSDPAPVAPTPIVVEVEPGDA
jgi:hypothetical protein